MKDDPVWQIAVTTLPEAEEAVAELMERLFRQTSWTYTDADTLVTEVAVYGLTRGDWSARRRSELAAGLKNLRHLGIPLGAGRIKARRVRRKDWAESWKRHFHPLEIGPELLLKPTWSKRKPRPGQTVVLIDPGLSFGTGHHATTAFCLNQLVAARTKDRPQSFLDMGTGSGILAIAAAKLGYAPVHAFDFDPESIRVARANAALNGVEPLIRLQRRDLTRLPIRSKERYDVVCANLLYDLLISERSRIIQRAHPSGRLVLAGILRTQYRAVRAAYRAAGWAQVRTAIEKEWQSGTFMFQKQASRFSARKQ